MLYPDTDDRTASVREATSSRLPAYSPTFARSSIVTVATTPLVRLPTTKKRTSVADTTRQYTLYVELAAWASRIPGPVTVKSAAPSSLLGVWNETVTVPGVGGELSDLQSAKPASATMGIAALNLSPRMVFMAGPFRAGAP